MCLRWLLSFPRHGLGGPHSAQTDCRRRKARSMPKIASGREHLLFLPKVQSLLHLDNWTAFFLPTVIDKVILPTAACLLSYFAPCCVHVILSKATFRLIPTFPLHYYTEVHCRRGALVLVVFSLSLYQYWTNTRS